jgi:hypothetical protein
LHGPFYPVSTVANAILAFTGPPTEYISIGVCSNATEVRRINLNASQEIDLQMTFKLYLLTSVAFEHTPIEMYSVGGPVNARIALATVETG